MKERIVIVGGGLVGAILSVYLAKRGYKVDVYDRNPDSRKTIKLAGKAINLTICDRGFRALDEVGAGYMVRELSVPAYGRYVHPPNGEPVFQPYGNNKEAIYSILRSELSKALVSFAEQHAGIDFHFNEKCTGLEMTPLKVEFTNQSTGKMSHRYADRVFAADGCFSAVRTLLQRMYRFNYSQEFLDVGYLELPVPASANAQWCAEKNVLHMWPRGEYVLLGFPNPDGSFTCSLHMPFEGEASFARIKTATDVTDFFEASFPDVIEHIPELRERFFASAPNPMLSVKCAPWTFGGKVALIGDAAHVLFPYYGQGANAGFEDCFVFIQCLEKHGEDWNAAMKEYERERKPNLDAIADLCVQHYIELRDRIGDPTFLLKKSIERKVSQMYPEVYLPLYSMIAFSCMPYAEAFRIDREQSLLIDQLASIEGIEEKLDSREVEALIEKLSLVNFQRGRNTTSPEPLTKTSAASPVYV